jgi:hypothetical protein
MSKVRWNLDPADRIPREEKAVLPPGLSVFSSSRTDIPSPAATKAAIMPHPPAPTIIKLLASASESAMTFPPSQ